MMQMLQERVTSLHELISMTSDILLVTSKNKYFTRTGNIESAGYSLKYGDNTLTELQSILSRPEDGETVR
jgi:hypothetical protein